MPRSHSGLFLLAALAGCGGDPLATYDGFAEANRAAFCDHEVACATIDAVDRAHCLAYTAGTNDLRNHLTTLAIEAKRLAYDPQAARQCLEAIAKSVCTEKATPDVCSRVTTPRVGAGGECVLTTECTDGRVCTGDTCPRHCLDAAPLERPDGASCSATQPCGYGQRCLLDLDGTPHCHGPGALGEPCFDIDPNVYSDAYCQAGLACDFRDPVPVCRPIASEGEACGGREQCTDDRTCRGLTITLDASSRPHVMREGQCAPFVAEGKPCDEDASFGANGCRRFAWCARGTCQPLPGLGSSCGAAPVCARGYCDPGTLLCAPLRLLGQVCYGAGECEPGLFCDVSAKVCRSPYCS